MTKVLFLDIDGVVNSVSTFTEDMHRDHAIDPILVSRVNDIVDATGCKIVISSTWRVLYHFNTLKIILRSYGLRSVVIDKTPDLVSEDKNRGDEINAWLHNHPEVTHFAILDDNADSNMRNLVQTTFKFGLQDDHVAAAIKILGAIC